ncbi:DNA polymerase V [Wallemia ichthyophaga EXF-994]|uniref:DNA polymerase V n=1 Tax=Wallemia ichthyophaga (strain EXF-994 / CBS 113033) TaxID=1299270 RepID=R9AGT8_WALI9|nr:DNA polymerase V [Wallemia ichthyophaga EXF-994]EOR01392.1 DNA polymerase V [Wallemia ichthyophaga EXF-994]TIB35375.1 hypothetical protein E3P84_01404 [Wallemia ichthyophaga]TIB42213.1 hypothetical protein E3P83_01353 [Wallemia ichthyophaga]
MSTLELYWPLASNKTSERLQASSDLINLLNKFQQDFKPADEDRDGEESDHSEPSDQEEDTVDKNQKSVIKRIEKWIEKHHAPDVSYAIKRLIRGLASPRESSRLGFAVTLTQLLSNLPLLTVAHVLPLIKHHTTPVGNVKGSEERDLIFGRLFGIQAIIESGLISRSTTTPDDFKETIRNVTDLGKNKVWLKEATGWTTLNGLKEVTEKNVSWLNQAITNSLDILFTGDEKEIWGPEKVGILLWLQSTHSDIDYSEYVQPIFKNPLPLAPQNLSVLARILRETSIDAEKATSGSGVWKPQLHWVWPQILDIYFTSDNQAFKPRASFQDFYRICIDESLFQTNASPQRKYWGFSVFALALPRLTNEDLGALFTPNFMRTWINNLRGEDRVLHKAALRIAQDLQPLIAQNPKLGLPLILQLLGKHGSANFDKLTGTKTVANILSSMTTDGVSEYVGYLRSFIQGETSDVKQRKWALDQLLSLIRNSQIPHDDEWVWSALECFVLNGIFVPRKPSSKSKHDVLKNPPQPPLSDTDRAAARSHLLSSLAELSKTPDSKKQLGVDKNGDLWVKRVYDFIQSIESEKNVITAVQYEEEVLIARKTALDSFSNVNKKGKAPETRHHAFSLLLLSVVLQSYDNMEGISDVLDELASASSMLFTVKSPKKNNSKQQENEDGEEPSAMAVLVDVLVSLLERSSSFLRTMAINAFTAFTPEVDEEALDMIIAQLSSQPDGEGEGEDGEEENEEMGDDEKGEEGEESDSENAKDAQDEVASDVSDDDKEDDINEAVDPEFERKLAKALGQPVSDDEDEEMVDEDEDGDAVDNVDNMTDEQMMMLDEQLAEIFKSRVGDKKAKEGAQREAQHTKNRLIDLLDVYAKKQSSNALVLKLIIPLVEIIVNSGATEQQLSSKSSAILRQRLTKSKDIPTTNINEDDLLVIFEEMHNVAKKSRTNEILSLCNQLSLYLFRIITFNYSGAVAESKAKEVYISSWQDFSNRKHTKLNPSVFTDYIRRYPTQSLSLLDELVQTVVDGKATNAYRQIQALTMLQTLFGQHKQLMDAGKKDDILASIPKIRQGIYSFIATSCESKDKTNASKLKDVLKSALALVRVHKKITDEKIEDEWDLTTLQSIVTTLGSIDKFKGVQSLAQQLSALITQSTSTSKTSSKKRKSSGNGTTEPEQSVKKNKQKQ